MSDKFVDVSTEYDGAVSISEEVDVRWREVDIEVGSDEVSRFELIDSDLVETESFDGMGDSGENVDGCRDLSFKRIVESVGDLGFLESSEMSGLVVNERSGDSGSYILAGISSARRSHEQRAGTRT